MSGEAPSVREAQCPRTEPHPAHTWFHGGTSIRQCQGRAGHGGYREGNPTYKLTEEDRLDLSILARMNLWSKTALAEEFGVSRKTVTKLS